MISNGAYFGGQFVTNAIYGSGALGTNSTGDARFDGVLNQYYDGGVSNVITVHNLIAGQQYAVQLFALDNRSGTTSELADFADADDLGDVSAQFAMGINVYLTRNVYRHEHIPNDLGKSFDGWLRKYQRPGGARIVIHARRQASHRGSAEAAKSNINARGDVFGRRRRRPRAQLPMARPGPWPDPYANLADGGRYAGTATCGADGRLM